VGYSNPRTRRCASQLGKDNGMRSNPRPAIPRRAARSCAVLALLLNAACGANSSASATSPDTTVSGPTSPGAFTIRMPIDASDTAHNAYGLWPYGVHGGGHASDGHPGWDIEFRLGANALAAADGIVDSMVAAMTPGAVAVQLRHTVGGRAYRTVYQNIGTLAAGITVNASVKAGQAIGVPVTQTLMIGTSNVTFAMIHFQVDDFSNPPGGLTNPMATGPDLYMDAAARPLMDAIWSEASYNQELCEPFVSNPRGATFPLTRVWTRESGAGFARIEFTRLDVNTSDYEYRLFGDGGTVVESGTLRLSANGRPPTSVTLQPSSGAARPALFDIAGDTMRIDIRAPGAPTPTSLAAATVYRTTNGVGSN